VTFRANAYFSPEQATALRGHHTEDIGAPAIPAHIHQPKTFHQSRKGFENRPLGRRSERIGTAPIVGCVYEP